MVHKFVVIEVCQLPESLLTEFTCERLHSSMDKGVSLQFGGRGEVFATLLACVNMSSFLIHVSFFYVCIQIYSLVAAVTDHQGRQVLLCFGFVYFDSAVQSQLICQHLNLATLLTTHEKLRFNSLSFLLLPLNTRSPRAIIDEVTRKHE